jgi:diketogulonate reductase-like aldo/keto reductase
LVSKVLPENASERGTIEACERSLRNLGTDRLDLYLLHWPGSHPLEGTIAAFERLVRDGKIRFWGVSNFDVAELEEAERIAGPGRIACNQVLYHLKQRAIEHAVLPWCAARGIAVVAYSPLGQGDFPRGRALEEVARARGATPAQAALRFLLRHETVFVIPKSSDPARAAENAGTMGVTLAAADLRRLDEAFPLGAPSALPML